MGPVLTREKLCRDLVEIAGITKDEARKAIRVIFDMIAKSLQEGNLVRIFGFGVFYISSYGPTHLWNFQYKQRIPWPARILVKFRPSIELKYMINQG